MPLPTVILPGYLASAQPYQAMENALAKQGFPYRASDSSSPIGSREPHA